jgi:hypothetical protein|tara:strand:- start:2557 stop:2946 length:390 start_codon:yes stop_codon:yes gene_type:complete
MGLDKVIVVAQNPGPGQPYLRKDGDMNAGSTIGKMHQWMQYIGIETFSFANTYPYPGQFTKKDINYNRLNKLTNGYDKVIALGNVASEALSKIGVEHFKLPHPSGLNRKLNDKKYVNKVLKECYEYCNR